MKTFNVHYQAFFPGESTHLFYRRGFSAVISQNVDKPEHVWLYMSWCSKKDEFNKKRGVEIALNHPPVSIHKKQVSRYLKECAELCHKQVEYYQITPSFDYVMKRFL